MRPHPRVGERRQRASGSMSQPVSSTCAPGRLQRARPSSQRGTGRRRTQGRAPGPGRSTGGSNPSSTPSTTIVDQLAAACTRRRAACVPLASWAIAASVGLSAVPDRYLTFDRDEWAALRAATPLTLRQDDLDSLQGINERIDLDEVVAIYLPLSRLLNLYVSADPGPPAGDVDVPRFDRAEGAVRRSASPGRWRSASRRSPASCRRCCRAGRRTRRSTS